jgi:hypothetical protein
MNDIVVRVVERQAEAILLGRRASDAQSWAVIAKAVSISARKDAAGSGVLQRAQPRIMAQPTEQVFPQSPGHGLPPS